MPFTNIQKISIQYDTSAVQNMLSMLKAAPFPSRAPLDAAQPWSLGIDYEYLKMLKTTMETKWKWEDLEMRVNKYENYLVDYKSDDGVDDLQLHFVHAKSKRQDAIPLILLHGWPGKLLVTFRFVVYLSWYSICAQGTFFDFHKVIEPLTNPPSADLPA